jgi:hypothetical protein
MAGENSWDGLSERRQGVVYIATGAASIGAAKASAASVRRSNPKLPVALFTDAASLDDSSLRAAFDGIAPVANAHRRSKVDYLSATPFERTLYLDADIRVYADLSGVFALLERFDVALAHAHSRNRERNTAPWRIELPGAFPQLNGGVIAYRASSAVRELLDSWRDAFHGAGFRKDQVTLRELLWLSDLRIATLPPEYNVRYLKYLWIWPKSEASLKILHHSAFRADGLRGRALDFAVRWLLRPDRPART